MAKLADLPPEIRTIVRKQLIDCHYDKELPVVELVTLSRLSSSWKTTVYRLVLKAYDASCSILNGEEDALAPDDCDRWASDSAFCEVRRRFQLQRMHSRVSMLCRSRINVGRGRDYTHVLCGQHLTHTDLAAMEARLKELLGILDMLVLDPRSIYAMVK